MKTKQTTDPTFYRLVLMTFGLIILMVTLFVVLALLSPTTAHHPSSILPHLIEVTIVP